MNGITHKIIGMPLDGDFFRENELHGDYARLRCDNNISLFFYGLLLIMNVSSIGMRRQVLCLRCIPVVFL